MSLSYRKFATACLSLSLAMNIGLAASVSTANTAEAAAEPNKLFEISDSQYDEAVKLLSNYIKIDTTNPPGNEKLGALYLQSVLKENGIDAQVFDSAKDRAIVIGRLKGTGKKKAVILLSHIDVVPAQASDWKYPPFAAEIHDGELWGRGTLDMKGMGIMELAAMLAIKKSGKVLDRDIIFIATPDEEVGGTYGAEWFAKNKKELVKDAEYLLNEGYSIESYNKSGNTDGKAKYWGVDYAEKSVLWLSLTANGLAGHASMPMSNSANNRLIKALAKIAENPPRMTLLPAAKEFFQSIAPFEASPLKELYADIEKTAKAPSKETEETLSVDKLKYSMLRNTVSITVLKAGYKTNVIPAQAYAELDCRLLPGVTPEQFVEEVKKTIGDSSIDVKVVEWEKGDPSPYDNDMFRAIKEANRAEGASAPVVPVVVPWFTDSHWFRELGIHSYGFEPIEVDADHLATMHGKDERIPLAAFRRGIDRLVRILTAL
ncbi:MAG: M20/M25/M40 family metallo-hydrolase [Candidatus Obscuribacterales bacterium]